MRILRAWSCILSLNGSKVNDRPAEMTSIAGPIPIPISWAKKVVAWMIDSCIESKLGMSPDNPEVSENASGLTLGFRAPMKFITSEASEM